MADGIPVIHGYSLGELIDKTILADKTVKVYSDARAGAVPIGAVVSGMPIGVLYSWLSPNFSAGRERIWLMFYPPNSWSSYYYVPYEDNAFDWSAIQQQGAITELERIEQEQQEQQESETPWYEKLFNWSSSDIVKPVINGALVLGGIYVTAKYILPAIMDATKKRKKEA